MLNDTHLKVIRANAMGCLSKIFYGEYVSPLSQVSLVNCKKINSFRKITTLVWFLLMSIRSKNVLNSWKTLFIIIFFFSIDTSSFKAVIFILLVKNRTESKIRPKKQFWFLPPPPPPPPPPTHTHTYTQKKRQEIDVISRLIHYSEIMQNLLVEEILKLCSEPFIR